MEQDVPNRAGYTAGVIPGPFFDPSLKKPWNPEWPEKYDNEQAKKTVSGGVGPQAADLSLGKPNCISIVASVLSLLPVCGLRRELSVAVPAA